jgi:serine/threonine protein kinase
VHRDLKPDNIMVDDDGEPILMDFGLARNMEEDIRISKSGALTGSPAYMSPEQAQGDQSKVGPPTDIYSLGVILFEILTGKIPFQGSIVSVLQKIVHEPPPRPSVMRSEILQDPNLKRLEELALKMMSKSPASRFASAAEVADAMDNYLRVDGGTSAQGRGPSWRRVFWPFSRK